MRIAVLDRGNLLQIGPAAEVYNHPANRTVAAMLRPLELNAFAGEMLVDGWSGDAPVAEKARQSGAELLIPVAEFCEQPAATSGLQFTAAVQVEQTSPWEGRQLVRARVTHGGSQQAIAFIAEAERKFAPAEVVRLSASRWFWADGPSGACGEKAMNPGDMLRIVDSIHRGKKHRQRDRLSSD